MSLLDRPGLEAKGAGRKGAFVTLSPLETSVRKGKVTEGPSLESHLVPASLQFLPASQHPSFSWLPSPYKVALGGL